MIGATRGWAKSVILWNLALDENHGPHTGGCGDCRGVVTISSGSVTWNVEYYALAHASRFTRPGARRIASTSNADRVETVASRMRTTRLQGAARDQHRRAAADPRGSLVGDVVPVHARPG